MRELEILAPAGGRESLLAAVRAGAGAVYFGGKNFNARRAAANFGGGELYESAKYCRARGVKAYLTLNTVLFDCELAEAADLIKSACEAGIDAVIVQDLAAAALVRECAPSLPLHASTQMSVHSVDGAKELEALGFTRVVLARELSKEEIAEIASGTSLSLECFVHGALCASVSGQCYFSAMLGTRSGNRGLCAQPCRLPAACGGREYCLSLKDLSLISRIPELAAAGVSSLKIEGRMKRPEYVAAAGAACRRKLSGEEPDLGVLKAVFSRDGFTSGYFDGALGSGMLGTRRREDVAAASPSLLDSLAKLYQNERRCVPVKFCLTLERCEPAVLTVSDGDGNAVSREGGIPEEAKTSPTTREKAAAALSKTGGTPFFPEEIKARIDGGLMLPASALNALRRGALDDLLKLREAAKPRGFTEKPEMFPFTPHEARNGRAFRVRIGNASQFTKTLADAAELMIVPASVLRSLDSGLLLEYAGKIAVQLPRVLFGGRSDGELDAILRYAKENGIGHSLAGNIGSVRKAREHGFAVHGDYSLNITNSLALSEYARLGLCDATLSFELSKSRIARLGGSLPRGILAYGHLPLMALRNCPAGDCGGCDDPVLTDRLGNKFPVRCDWGVSEMLNCVPLFIADRLDDFAGTDFFTLYFTGESPRRCAEILRLYQTGGKADFGVTRGLYYRSVS